MAEDIKGTLQSMGFRAMGFIGTRAECEPPRKVNGRPSDSLAFVLLNDEAVRKLYDSVAPALYIWLGVESDRPLYVGKAGKGLKARWKQWEGGFYGTSDQRARVATSGGKPVTGLAMASRIRALPPGTVQLWARPAGSISLLGHQGTLVSAEEEMLIAMLQPRWNDGGDEVENIPTD